jgi:preprotein translocase subunit SecB
MTDKKTENNKEAAANEKQEPSFVIQRIYAKESSIETPNSPKIFLTEWKPELSMDLETKTSALEDNHHEVILRVTATVKIEKDTAFVVEVQQAGIFAIQGVDEDQLKHMLGSFCPNILYPYARELITSLVTHAGFPQLYIAPVNFDALYEQHLQGQGEAGESSNNAANDKEKH